MDDFFRSGWMSSILTLISFWKIWSSEGMLHNQLWGGVTGITQKISWKNKEKIKEQKVKILIENKLCGLPPLGHQWFQSLFKYRIELLNFSMGFNIIAPYMEMLHINRLLTLLTITDMAVHGGCSTASMHRGGWIDGRGRQGRWEVGMAGCDTLPGQVGQILAPSSCRHGPLASLGIGTYRKLNWEYLCFLVVFARAVDVATPSCAKKLGMAKRGPQEQISDPHGGTLRY